MSSTIRTYRHSPTQAADATGTLVDTEVDADDGPFTVTVDTTGWTPGNYQVSVTREYTTGGLSESAKSNPLDVTASAAGYSDDFNGPADQLLATHDSNWADLGNGYLVANCELDGSGNMRIVTNWEMGARYTASSSDTSTVVLNAYAGAQNHITGPAVRCTGSAYYAGSFQDITGGYWQSIFLRRTADVINSVDISSYNIATNASHTVKMVASGTSPVNIKVYVDDVERLNYNDSTAPIASGSPGFLQYDWGSGHTFASWQDY